MTINPEINEQVHTIVYLLYIQQNYSVADVFEFELFVLVFFSFFLLVAHVCQTFNQVCAVFNVILFFAFSISFSTMSTDSRFDKSNRLSAIFFFIWCTNLALPQGFHANLCIALHKLFMHSSLTNQNLGNMLSI